MNLVLPSAHIISKSENLYRKQSHLLHHPGFYPLDFASGWSLLDHSQAYPPILFGGRHNSMPLAYPRNLDHKLVP